MACCSRVRNTKKRGHRGRNIQIRGVLATPIEKKITNGKEDIQEPYNFISKLQRYYVDLKLFKSFTQTAYC